MDFLLIDIKNFLKKLESGQHDIEAGQWELHRDISNIKKIIDELKNLKDDVEKMRLSSVQQIGMMKGLQAKIDMMKQDCENEEPVTVSERSLEIEKVSKRPNENQAKGYKKRKCHVVRSEEIIEITSQISEEKSNDEESDSKCEQAEETNDRSLGDYGAPRSHYRQICADGLKEVKKNERYAKDPNILQRYLQDSAKYSDRKGTAETSGSQWSNCKESDESYTPFWDEYGSRAAPESNVENQEENEEESEESKPVESILPTRVSSSSSSNRQRHVTYKANYDRARRKHGKSGGVHYCVTCGKGFHSRGRMKEHESLHEAEGRNSKGYRCSYCHKPCATPEKLTSHLRRCRIIMRSHYKRRN